MLASNYKCSEVYCILFMFGGLFTLLTHEDWSSALSYKTSDWFYLQTFDRCVQLLWDRLVCFVIKGMNSILWCPYFASLREGKSLDNDLDLINYFKQVFKIREDKEINDEWLWLRSYRSAAQAHFILAEGMESWGGGVVTREGGNFELLSVCVG